MAAIEQKEDKYTPLYKINEPVYFVSYDLALKMDSFCPIKGVIIGFDVSDYPFDDYYIIKPVQEDLFDFFYINEIETIKLNVNCDRRNAGGFVSMSFEKTQKMAVNYLADMTISVFKKNHNADAAFAELEA